METKAAAIPSYTPTQFYATKSYMGNDINHKADALLVASDETGVFNLYKVSLDGKTWTPLTSSTTESILPIGWFPEDDRRTLSAPIRVATNCTISMCVNWTGSVKDLTPGDKHKAEFIGWTDDNKFWVMSNERDPKFFDLYSYDSSSYQRTLVYQNDEGYDIGALSDNGRYIALSKERTNADNNLYLVDLPKR